MDSISAQPISSHGPDIVALEQRLRIASDDRRRLTVMCELVAAVGEDDPEYAIRMAGDGYRLATLLGDIGAAAQLLYLRGRSQIARSDIDPAIRDLSESFTLASDLELYDLAATGALAIGRAYDATGAHREALDWFSSALEIGRRHNLPGAQADALESLGTLRTDLGDYARALGHYLDCLALREDVSDSDGRGRVLMAVGVVYARSGNFGSAFDYYSQALETFRASGNRYQEVRALTHLGNLHFDRGELETALELGLTSVTIYEALGDREHLARALSMIGKIYDRKGSSREALEFQMKAYDLVKSNTDEGLLLTILLEIGRLHSASGAFQEALFVFDQAMRIARERDDSYMEHEFHLAISTVYERLGRFAKALEHFKQFVALRDRLIGRERQKEMAELQVRYELDKAERERELYRLKAQHLETEMRLKQNELTAMALNLLQKKEMLEQLQRQLESLKGGDDGDGSMADVDRILREIRENRNADNEWKSFEQQLDNLHQDFIRRLSERYPSLTPTELKICSLTRLNLQAKDIANLLFTSVRTIHAHRYNIRKKLDLASDISLTTFLVGV